MQSPAQPTKYEDRVLRFALAFGVVMGLICLFYFEENWRGKRDWANTRQQLTARGEPVDWTNFIPAVVKPEENFFGAPNMQRWFSGRGNNDLSSRIGWNRDNFLDQYHGDVLAEITVIKPGENIVITDADLVLDFDAAFSAIVLSATNLLPDASMPTETIPLIVMDQVPLLEAIKNLARTAGLTYMLDPNIRFGGIQRDGSLHNEPVISNRWENLTARQALGAILKANDLQYVPDPKTGIDRITTKPKTQGTVYSEPATAKRLGQLLSNSISAITNDFPGHTIATSLGLTLLSATTVPVKPLRVIARAENAPTTNELADFFPPLPTPVYNWQKNHFWVEATGSNTFKIRLAPPSAMSAKDYLSWSESLEPDFELIRAALKRPYSQIEGDYREPVTIPIPNFVCERILAQTLSDRAKCNLLLNRPEEALRDLTLIRGICRILECKPTGRPMTLVAAMINSAITGLYLDIIGEGLRLRAWHEPQLIEIQRQLKEIDMLPALVESFRMERASICSTLENSSADKFRSYLYGGPPSTNLWEKLKDPNYLFFKVGPRGWVYENMTKVALLNQKVINSFNLTNRTVSPRLIENTGQKIESSLKHFSPYIYLLSSMIPNFSRAIQNLAKNQSLAGAAQIACALERYRLAHAQFPKTLDALVPQSLDKIPADIINGQSFKYRLSGEKFILYSVGWNEKDDNGTVTYNKSSNPTTDNSQGDWVWPDSLK
jgi:hypothetical protein